MRSDYFVYALFRETGQPFYIGKGCGQRRMTTLNPRNGTNHYKNRVLELTRQALGSVPFVILHSGLDEATAYLYETSLIEAIGRFPEGPLANMTDGGGGVSNLSPEARAVMSRKLQGNKNSLGVVHTIETRTKISLAKVGNQYNKGRKQSPEHVANKAAALKRWANSPEGKSQLSKQNYGKRLSSASIEKIRASKIGKKLSEEHKEALRAGWARKKALNVADQDNRLP